MKIKNIVLIALALTALSIGLLHNAAFSKGIEWQSYSDGMARGKFEKKKVFLHFYAEWCPACKTMEDSTFKDPGVIASLNKDFIPIKVDVDIHKQTSAFYRVQALPDNWFIAENTDIIGHQLGYISPDQLKKILKSLLDNNRGQ
jgi:thiol:disulfide interchange protein DsbD